MKVTTNRMSVELDGLGLSAENNEVLRRCVQLCKNYNVKIRELVEDLMGLALENISFGDRDQTMVVTMAVLDEYEKCTPVLQSLVYDTPVDSTDSEEDSPTEVNTEVLLEYDSEYKTEQLQKQYVTPSPKKCKSPLMPGASHEDKQNPRARSKLFSPKFTPASYSPNAHSPSAKYSGRRNPGEIMCCYNGITEWKPILSVDNVPPLLFFSALINCCPYMFERLRDKVAVLDDYTKKLGTAIYLQESLEYQKKWPLADISKYHQEKVACIGRIMNRSEDRMKPNTMFLQGTRESCFGTILPLDVNKLLKPVALFPGQVVKVEGQTVQMNIPAHQKFVVRDISTSAPFPALDIPYDTQPLRLMVACGPFTLGDSLSFDPLRDLIKDVNQYKPHFLILIGPFLDVSQPNIYSVMESFEEFFELVFQDLISNIVGTTIILVSSARDAFQETVYPTPPFVLSEDFDHIQILSDPCIFIIGGLVVAVTATDILFHLGKQEMASARHPVDRISRLASHLLQQRSFYPLYPPMEDVPLDMELWEDYCQLPVKPHIFILPSDFQHFAKEVDDCVIVNPERLAKESGGGMYARIDFKPPSNGLPITSANIHVQVIKI